MIADMALELREIPWCCTNEICSARKVGEKAVPGKDGGGTEI
jgi:hypothetical protein